MKKIEELLKITSGDFPDAFTEQTMKLYGNLGILQIEIQWVNATSLNWMAENRAKYLLGLRYKVPGRISFELTSKTELEHEKEYYFKCEVFEPFKIKVYGGFKEYHCIPIFDDEVMPQMVRG